MISSGGTQSSQANESTETKKFALNEEYIGIKRAFRVTVLLFALAAVSYVLVTAFVERLPGAVPADLPLDGHSLLKGANIILSATRNGQQQLLVSSDSGRHFRPSGSWPVGDTVLFLGVTSDSSYLVALQANGWLHSKSRSSAGFQTTRLDVGPRDTIRGMVPVPGTDSLYLFGSFNGIFACSVSHPQVLTRTNAPDSGPIVSIAVDEDGNCLAVAGSLHYKGASLGQMEVFRPRGGDWKVIRQSFFYNNPNEPLTYVMVGLNSSTKHFYDVFYSLYEKGISISAVEGLSVDTARYVARFPFFTKGFIDQSGHPVFYGNGPYLQYGSALDTVPEAGSILNVYMDSAKGATLALVANPSGKYLFQKNSGAWTVNPVLVDRVKDVRLSNALASSAVVFMVTMLALVGAAFAWKAKIERKIDGGNTSNPLLTKPEKPLGIDGEDLLGFASLEDAVTKIIRNPQLELPMTLVVSGTWGSGKSSMMNRIRENLERDPELSKRFMTTWFNAWHMQGENNLLNAFLLNIIDCYERNYHFYSAFRIKVAASRYNRLPFWKKFAFGFAMAVILPFLVVLIFRLALAPLADIPAGISEYCLGVTSLFSNGLKDSTATIGTAILTFISLLFVNKQFVSTGLSAFFKLIPTNNFAFEAEKEPTGSRDKFRQQYWEIMAAGRQDQRLVVFIDDVDRIPGDKILELLEAINFVSDIASQPPGGGSLSANTIFVLGMYTQEVARLVGTRLIAVNSSAVPAAQLGSAYIEKMVQLIVPVPFDADNQAKLKKLYEN